MEQQRLLTGPPPTALDETFFSAYSQGREDDEEVAQDLLSSAPTTQHVDIWSDRWASPTQYSTGPLSQLGQSDLSARTRWDNYSAADPMVTSMSLQAANDANVNYSSFQAPQASYPGWVFPNTLQSRYEYDVADQQMQLNRNLLLDETLGEIPSTVGGYLSYHDPGWQPVNFEAIQEPTSMLVPYDSSTRNSTTLPSHPTMMNPASSEATQIPQISNILASGPFDFAEIDRQALWSSEHEVWQQLAQTDGSGCDSNSLDAPPIPYLNEIDDLSAHGGLSVTSHMVLPTRTRESPLLIAPVATNVHLPLAPKPRTAQIPPTTSSQAPALVPSTAVSRRSSARPTSKLITKTIRQPRRPAKHAKRRKSGALESLPGYHVYPLEALNTVRKHNSRYDKKRGSSEQLARDFGACILCEHSKKQCVWSPPNMPCERCIKMIQYGGIELSGVKITACLTSFQDLISGTRSSKASRELRTALAEKISPFPQSLVSMADGEFCPIRFATFLDLVYNQEHLRNPIPTDAVALTKNLLLARMIFSLSGGDSRVAELMTYHTALFCYTLTRDARSEFVNWFRRIRNKFHPAFDELIPMSDDDFITRLRSKLFQSTTMSGIEILATFLQLTKALNADGDVITSYELVCVRSLLKTAQKLLNTGRLLDHRWPLITASSDT